MNKLWTLTVWIEKKKEVEGTVPTIWIQNRKVMWPPGNSAKRALNDMKKPDNNWLNFDLVKIKFQSDSRKACEDYDQTTTAELSEAEEVEILSKRKSKKKRFADFVTDQDEMSVMAGDDQTVINKRVLGSAATNDMRNDFPAVPPKVSVQNEKRRASASHSRSISDNVELQTSGALPQHMFLEGTSASPFNPLPSRCSTPDSVRSAVFSLDSRRELYRTDRRSRSPRPLDRRSRSPRPRDRWSRSPRPRDRWTRSPRTVDRWSRSPRPRDRWTRSPRTVDRRSRSPRTVDRRSRSPRTVDRRSRSPRTVDRRSRSPRTVDRRSRSPRTVDRRSRSPRTVDRRSRSPYSAVRRSRSPYPRDRWSRSPCPVGRRSRSPYTMVRQSRSPFPEQRRSGSSNRQSRSPLLSCHQNTQASTTKKQWKPGTTRSMFPMPEARFQRMVLQLLSEIKDNTSKTDEMGDCNTFSVRQASTLEDVESMEEVLSDLSKQALLKAHLQRIGGLDYKDHLKKAMLRTLSNGVMAKMNLNGHNGKFAFKKTQLCRIILECVTREHSVSETQVLDVMAKYLKYAPERSGGGGRK